MRIVTLAASALALASLLLERPPSAAVLAPAFEVNARAVCAGNDCLQIVRARYGTRCGNRSSVEVDVTNGSLTDKLRGYVVFNSPKGKAYSPVYLMQPGESRTGSNYSCDASQDISVLANIGANPPYPNHESGTPSGASSGSGSGELSHPVRVDDPPPGAVPPPSAPRPPHPDGSNSGVGVRASAPPATSRTEQLLSESRTRDKAISDAGAALKAAIVGPERSGTLEERQFAAVSEIRATIASSSQHYTTAAKLMRARRFAEAEEEWHAAIDGQSVGTQRERLQHLASAQLSQGHLADLKSTAGELNRVSRAGTGNVILAIAALAEGNEDRALRLAREGQRAFQDKRLPGVFYFMNVEVGAFLTHFASVWTQSPGLTRLVVSDAKRRLAGPDYMYDSADESIAGMAIRSADSAAAASRPGADLAPAANPRPLAPHVVRGANGKLNPEAGYEWLNASAAADLRVRPVQLAERTLPTSPVPAQPAPQPTSVATCNEPYSDVYLARSLLSLNLARTTTDDDVAKRNLRRVFGVVVKRYYDERWDAQLQRGMAAVVLMEHFGSDGLASGSDLGLSDADASKSYDLYGIGGAALDASQQLNAACSGVIADWRRQPPWVAMANGAFDALKRGDLISARSRAERVLLLDSRAAMGHLILGSIAGREGHFEEATTLLNRAAAELQPSDGSELAAAIQAAIADTMTARRAASSPE